MPASARRRCQRPRRGSGLLPVQPFPESDHDLGAGGGAPLSPAAGHPGERRGPAGPGCGPGRPAGLSLGVRRHPLPCLRPHAGGELCRPQPGGAARGHGPAGGDLRGLMPAVHSPAQKSRPPQGRPALCIGFSVHTPGFPSSAVMLFLKWTANMVAVVHTARKSATGSARKTAKALSAKKLGRI